MKTLSFLLVGISVAGCNGFIKGDGSGSGTGEGTQDLPEDVAGRDIPGVLPLRRLTRNELGNTLQQLLGAQNAVANLPEDAIGSSGFYTPTPPSTLEVRYILEAAIAIGQSLTEQQLDAVIGCKPATAAAEGPCALEFVTRFGRRAYRRPLSSSEVETLVELFNHARTTLKYTFQDSARLVVKAFLQSPNFLYHREAVTTVADAEGLIPLDSHGLASRLSYFLWSSMPDDALFAAADEGRLSTPDDLAREARRMIRDAKFRDTLGLFHRQWLGLEGLEMAGKDPTLYPQFNEALALAMERETLDFVSEVVIKDGKFRTLLTAPYSFVNADLAKLYGVTGANIPAGMTARVELNPAQRAGVLTQAAFLTRGATANDPLPPRRGKHILEQLLCRSVPPPPVDVPPPPEPTETTTNRQRFEEHKRNGCAAACHGMIDPLGFAFENYDAIGGYRTHDTNQPVDASGSLALSKDGTLTPFKNGIELVSMLAGSEEVNRCVATHWFRFALGRSNEKGDIASFNTIMPPFLKSDTDVRELLVAIVQTRSFRYRTPSEGEVLR